MHIMCLFMAIHAAMDVIHEYTAPYGSAPQEIDAHNLNVAVDTESLRPIPANTQIEF